MVRTLLIASLLLSACASGPAANTKREAPIPVQASPSDGFATRKPEQIAQSSTGKLGELRSVPVAAKAAPESGRRDAPADLARH